MGLKAATRWPAAAAVFRRADDLLDFSLSAVCHRGPAEVLTCTANAQAAIFVTSVAVLEGRREAGLFEPAHFQATAGLSLGEYTALWFAGVVSFDAGLMLVRRRGLAMQAAADAMPSGMTSLVGADRATAERVCERARESGILVVANLNAPGQVVLSGDKAALARVPQAAAAEGVRRVIALAVAGAFHSPVMASASAALETAIAATTFSSPRIPVYSNVTARPVSGVDEIRSLLARQVVAPVLWEASMRQLAADGFTEFAEPPPGRVLAALARKTLDGAVVQAIDEGD